MSHSRASYLGQQYTIGASKFPAATNATGGGTPRDTAGLQLDVGSAQDLMRPESVVGSQRSKNVLIAKKRDIALGRRLSATPTLTERDTEQSYGLP